MRRFRYRETCVAVSVFASLATSTVAGPPTSTAFSYQGQLKRNGSPFTGDCDIEIALFGAASEVVPMATESFIAVPVVGGLFTVRPDFGTGLFGESPSYLEVTLDCDASGPITLAPREEITYSPKAGFSLRTRGIGVDDLGRVGIGTATPEGQLDVRGPVFVQGAPGLNDSSNIMMKKSGLQAPDNVLFALSHRSDGHQLWLWGKDGVTFRNLQSWDYAANAVQFPPGGGNMHLDLSTGRTGFGTTLPGAKVTISRPTQAAASQLELRNEGSIQAPNFDGVSFTQNADGSTELASMKVRYRNNGRPDLSFSVRDTADALFINGNHDGRAGNVGIGTTVPTARLHVNGDLRVEGDVIVPSTTRYLVVGAADMIPQRSSMSVYRSFATIVSFFAPAGQATTLYAPVHLPDGATVTELRAFLHDNVPDSDVFVSFEAESVSGGSLILAVIFTEGIPGTIEAVDDTIESAVIDNSTHAYYLRAVYTVPPADGETYFSIRPVRIAYEVTTLLP